MCFPLKNDAAKNISHFLAILQAVVCLMKYHIIEQIVAHHMKF